MDNSKKLEYIRVIKEVYIGKSQRWAFRKEQFVPGLCPVIDCEILTDDSKIRIKDRQDFIIEIKDEMLKFKRNQPDSKFHYNQINIKYEIEFGGFLIFYFDRLDSKIRIQFLDELISKYQSNEL